MGTKHFEIVTVNKKYPLQSVHLKSKVSGNSLIIIHNPTYNCQIISIGYIYDILDKRCSLQHEMLLEILGIIYYYGLCKQMIMIDIYQDYVNIFKELFQPYLIPNPYTDSPIVLEAPYTSTNGSKMCILLLRIAWDYCEEILEASYKIAN